MKFFQYSRSSISSGGWDGCIGPYVISMCVGNKRSFKVNNVVGTRTHNESWEYIGNPWRTSFKLELIY